MAYCDQSARALLDEMANALMHVIKGLGNAADFGGATLLQRDLGGTQRKAFRAIGKPSQGGGQGSHGPEREQDDPDRKEQQGRDEHR